MLILTGSGLTTGFVTTGGDGLTTTDGGGGDPANQPCFSASSGGGGGGGTTTGGFRCAGGRTAIGGSTVRIVGGPFWSCVAGCPRRMTGTWTAVEGIDLTIVGMLDSVGTPMISLRSGRPTGTLTGVPVRILGGALSTSVLPPPPKPPPPPKVPPRYIGGVEADSKRLITNGFTCLFVAGWRDGNMFKAYTQGSALHARYCVSRRKKGGF